MDIEAILARLVQIGRVSAVDNGKKMVRVIFTKSGMTSGWLKVLQRSGGNMTLADDGGHTHGISLTDTYTGGGSATIEVIPDHSHPGSKTTAWMPKVNDQVVVLYLPIADGDGFVLGGI